MAKLRDTLNQFNDTSGINYMNPRHQSIRYTINPCLLAIYLQKYRRLVSRNQVANDQQNLLVSVQVHEYSNLSLTLYKRIERFSVLKAITSLRKNGSGNVRIRTLR